MRVALALGSGGARGYAHIGVLRELESRGHEVVHFSGASMGAVVGGLAAAGRLDEFEKWVTSLSQRDVIKLLDVSFSGGGAIRANRIMSVIGELLDGVRIEDLRVPYTAVATDIRARREVWFTSGPVDVAVRASFAIPSVITPAVVGGRLMVDGGVTNPVPLEPLATTDSDMVMAVSLTGRRAGVRGSTLLESSDPDEDSSRSEPTLGRRGRRTRGLGERIRTAAGDVRETELLRMVAGRIGQAAGDTDPAVAAGDDDTVEASEEVTRAVAEGERVVTHYFAATRPGYVGWRWSVTLTRAKRAKEATANEVVLLPGDDAIVAPPWVPYKERLQPGDLSPGDLLPVEDEDARLVPTYLVGDDPLDADDLAQVRRVAADLGLGRVRTLSREGIDMAAERWYAGSGGPDAPLAKSAPEPCTTCAFLVRLAGPLAELFGVCANGNANDDGRVVSFDHGCGAHSEVKLARRQRPTPMPDHVHDTLGDEDELDVI